MPEESFQEKTEPATPRRRRRARERGEVAKSMEINSIFVLFCGFLILRFCGEKMVNRLSWNIGYVFENTHKFSLTAPLVPEYFREGIVQIFNLLSPFLLIIVLGGLSANLIQTKFLLSFHPLIPDLNRINPINGLRRLFSKRSFTQLLFSLLKISIICYIAYITIWSQSDRFFLLVDKSVGQILVFLISFISQLGLRSCLALAPLSILDYVLQHREYEKKLRMTKWEALEEYKETEGNPLIKTRIRSLRKQIAKHRMMQEIPEADVVITNPTHIAVVLKYKREEMNAPIVVAKGARIIAEKIKEIAKKHNIPLIENKWLAQALYKSVEIGEEIPVKFYKAVAEILAYIYRLKKSGVNNG